jgi:hypothetical protein
MPASLLRLPPRRRILAQELFFPLPFLLWRIHCCASPAGAARVCRGTWLRTVARNHATSEKRQIFNALRFDHAARREAAPQPGYDPITAGGRI